MTEKEFEKKIMKTLTGDTKKDEELRNIIGKLLVMNSEEIEKVVAVNWR